MTLILKPGNFSRATHFQVTKRPREGTGYLFPAGTGVAEGAANTRASPCGRALKNLGGTCSCGHKLRTGRHRA
jgi:hypothetical protein